MSFTTGSFAFTYFNADGNDDFSIVVLRPLDGGQTVVFSDNEWTGTTMNTGEGGFTWTTPVGGIAAGTEIRFTQTSSATNKAVSQGTLGTGVIALGNSDESIYAYTGTLATPTTFVAAISNNAFSNAASGSLSGTGLSAGTTAVALTGNVDVAVYNGSLDFSTGFNSQATSVAAAQAAIGTTTPVSGTVDSATVYTEGNWITQGGSGDQSADSIGPDTSYGARSFSVICFYPGTHIATPAGPRAVETLAIGDLVLTTEGTAAPIRWMGRQTVSTTFADPMRVLPIRIAAGALADNIPARDLLVSPDHAILVDGVLIQAGALVNGTTITREARVPATFTYFHVELANHSLILAENVPAETFVDNVDRLAFDNWDEHEALYGNLPAIAEMDRPRAKSHRQVPQALRAQLAARAALLGRTTLAA